MVSVSTGASIGAIFTWEFREPVEMVVVETSRELASVDGEQFVGSQILISNRDLFYRRSDVVKPKVATSLLRKRP